MIDYAYYFDRAADALKMGTHANDYATLSQIEMQGLQEACENVAVPEDAVDLVEHRLKDTLGWSDDLTSRTSAFRSLVVEQYVYAHATIYQSAGYYSRGGRRKMVEIAILNLRAAAHRERRAGHKAAAKEGTWTGPQPVA